MPMVMKSYSLWWAGLLGAVDGFLFGCSTEFISRAYFDYQERLTIEEFNSVGMHPPLMQYMVRWSAIVVTATIRLHGTHPERLVD
jgi:hypothetical protein